MPHNLKALLPPQIKSKKRKRRSSKTDESDQFINCVKTYRQKLNEEILSQKTIHFEWRIRESRRQTIV